jgi:hypothetical protein
MNATTTRVFTPHEQALLDKYRTCNVDYDGWSEFTIENFCTTARAFGFSLRAEDLQWSGFWSQGDGASFVFSPVTLYELLTAGDAVVLSGEYEQGDYGFLALYEAIDKLVGVEARLCSEGRAVAEGITLVARRTSTHYCHSGTVMVDAEVDIDEDTITSVPGLCARLFPVSDSEYWSIETTRKQLDDLISDIADTLYRALEAEYEHQTSDEVVWESILANEWLLLSENQPETDDEEDVREAA